MSALRQSSHVVHHSVYSRINSLRLFVRVRFRLRASRRRRYGRQGLRDPHGRRSRRRRFRRWRLRRWRHRYRRLGLLGLITRRSGAEVGPSRFEPGRRRVVAADHLGCRAADGHDRGALAPARHQTLAPHLPPRALLDEVPEDGRLAEAQVRVVLHVLEHDELGLDEDVLQVAVAQRRLDLHPRERVQANLLLGARLDEPRVDGRRVLVGAFVVVRLHVLLGKVRRSHPEVDVLLAVLRLGELGERAQAVGLEQHGRHAVEALAHRAVPEDE
mmetsp:Transcript_7069/g.25160  ORF Transcript_7069/g.25160 Transcript_7069/m.25160 type:complete len:272 (+) Transcript_7069:120-935(+)